METNSQPKPVTETIRPHLTRLPELHWRRRLFRWIARGLIWLIVRLATRAKVRGLQNLVHKGPALIVSNHLGDADVLVGIAFSPVQAETVGKVDLTDLPVVGKLLDWYGFIWVHRGQPDRRAIQVVLQALSQGLLVAIAPEGRESVTGSLEEGTGGAAYLALKADVPIIPVTFTGTENARIFVNLKKLRRTDVSLTVGEPFRLEQLENRKQAIQRGTYKIMKTLARQLPPEYRGVYRDKVEDIEVECA